MIDSQETLVLFAKKYCTSIGRFSANYTTNIQKYYYFIENHDHWS